MIGNVYKWQSPQETSLLVVDGVYEERITFTVFKSNLDVFLPYTSYHDIDNFFKWTTHVTKYKRKIYE